MRIALVGFGSLGDVHPLLALAIAIKSLGHEPVVLTNPVFRQYGVKLGIPFISVGFETDYTSTIHHPKLWHPVDGLGVMWRYLLRPALRPTVEKINELCAGGQLDLVLASPVAMGARIAHEITGVPLVTLYTAATMLRSVENPLTIANRTVPALTPRFMRRAAWQLLDRLKLDPLVAPALEPLRNEYGLIPVRSSFFGDWIHSPLACWALFPEWFASASDWPRQLRHVGFPYFDHDSDEELDPDLERFLTAGSKPVVFAPGTAARGGEAFYANATLACQQLGIRGVLLGDVPDALVSGRSKQFWRGSYVPFSQLLPRARALVHHGGIGTLAQGLRAGLPQVAVPSGFDQFDNAHRLKSLGCGDICAPHQLTELGNVLSRALARDDAVLRLLSKTSVSLQSADFPGQIDQALRALFA